jgi:flagellar biosynthesis protein FlhF
MKVKSYTADTVAAALQSIKLEMGGEAIVLKTRKVVSPKGSQRIEVIACVKDEETNTATPDALAVPTDNVTSVATEKQAKNVLPEIVAKDEIHEPPKITSDLNNRLDRLERILTRFLISPEKNEDSDELMPYRRLLAESDFSEEFIESLIHDSLLETAAESDSDLATSIRSGLVRRFASVMQPSLEFNQGDRVLFIGPSGAGKSSVMGKLAAQLIGQQKSKVRLASIDDFKIGGSEELNSYADLLGLKSYSSFEISGSIKSDSSEIVLIDSPGLTSEESERKNLFDKINELNPTHCIFVFSALTRPLDLYTMAEWGRAATPTHFAMTMMDLSGKYGGIMKLAGILNCKMVWTTEAPGGIGDIQAPDPNAMARSVLQVEEELCKV